MAGGIKERNTAFIWYWNNRVMTISTLLGPKQKSTMKVVDIPKPGNKYKEIIVVLDT